MKKIDYDELISRIEVFRTQANLSRRETSLRLGFTEQFMKRIETKKVELKVRTLLDFCDLVEIHPFELFYMGKEFSEEDKNILDLYNSLSGDNKKMVVELMRKLK